MPKEKRQTREELIIQVARNSDALNNWQTNDEARRKEFAKAFGWAKKLNTYYEEGRGMPTWVEIFVEIGKLLVARSFTDFEGNISELDVRVENIEKKIFSEIKKELN